MENCKTVFLLTGSNIGRRAFYLKQAYDHILEKVGDILVFSSVFETEAWGVTVQADFLNQALEVCTSLSPEELLIQVKQIEKKIGRTHNKKWGERIIDIDILFYENLIVKSDRLTIPHPHLHERNFALAPMCEIAPDLIHPVLNKSIQALYDSSPDTLRVGLPTFLA